MPTDSIGAHESVLHTWGKSQTVAKCGPRRNIIGIHLQTPYKSVCPQKFLQTYLLIQMKQKYPMKMSANNLKLGTVSFQLNVDTNISKKNVKSKIAITSALKDTLQYAVMALDVKELVIINLNMLKKNKPLRNINLLREIILNKQLFRKKFKWKKFRQK